MKIYGDSIDERLTGRHKKCIEICGDLKGKKLLNIGCYNGWFEKVAVEKGCSEVVGIDIKDEFIDFSKRNVRNVEFLKASVLNLSFKEKSFDFVTMFDVIEHIPKGKEKVALMEVHKVLKDGGKAIISTPKSNLPSNILDPAWYFGHRHYSPAHITALLEDSGFAIERMVSAGGFYEIFAMLLLYFFKWVLHKEMAFKKYFDIKRDEEYRKDNGLATIFIKVRKHAS